MPGPVTRPGQWGSWPGTKKERIRIGIKVIVWVIRLILSIYDWIYGKISHKNEEIASIECNWNECLFVFCSHTVQTFANKDICIEPIYQQIMNFVQKITPSQIAYLPFHYYHLFFVYRKSKTWLTAQNDIETQNFLKSSDDVMFLSCIVRYYCSYWTKFTYYTFLSTLTHKR